jgi:hypothetical protein
MKVRLILLGAAFVGAAAFGISKGINTDYITPEFTFSPDHHYAVTVPVFHFEAAEQADDRKNQIVEVQTHRVIGVITGEPGYDRALNYHETAPPRWSQDSSLLLWKVNGKWNPDALMLVRIEGNKIKWQIDLLHTAQQAVLEETRKAAPEQYAAAKKANAGSGLAFPDGFTIDVTTDGEDTKTVGLPLIVHADLTANPKAIEDLPNLNSYLDAVVEEGGRFTVNDFHLGARKQ